MESKSKQRTTRGMRWEDLPHEPLKFLIETKISHRQPSEAYKEAERFHLAGKLSLCEEKQHGQYISLVAGELKRELRFCRDVYREYLDGLNGKSAYAKARVALDFAVGPMAAKRFRDEAAIYVRRTVVDDKMFATLFHPLAGRLLGRGDYQQEWLTTELVLQQLIPDNCFTEISQLTSRALQTLASGPFATPAEPFVSLVFVGQGLIGKERDNAIWNLRNLLIACHLCWLWDAVFEEIENQHLTIDLAEKASAAWAMTKLTAFERFAGRLFQEESSRHSTVPDEGWVEIGRALDARGFSLEDYIGNQGKFILRELSKRRKPISTWEEALSDKKPHRYVPGEVADLRDYGTLSRHAKKAIYRAKDAYVAASAKIHEKRARPEPIHVLD